jgi:hypothetical protein
VSEVNIPANAGNKLMASALVRKAAGRVIPARAGNSALHNLTRITAAGHPRTRGEQPSCRIL